MAETFLQILLQKTGELKALADSIHDENMSQAIEELAAVLNKMEDDPKYSDDNTGFSDCVL